nr:glycoside hydrolase family 28 protein [uncultured Gemmiger sp.]
MEYIVLDYGAKGDGSTNDAPSIQKALDACAANGGGRVILPGGHVYSCGTIFLRSNVELYLESGAVLKACADPAAFCSRHADQKTAEQIPYYENCDYDGEPPRCFVVAQEAENVRVSGFGSIDGSEENYYGEQTNDFIEGTYYPRVPLLMLYKVQHLSITGVTLTRSAFWTVHMVGCSDVLIDGIRILNNTRMVNCDGIDPDHCRNVRICNCHIESADDCIVLKNTGKYTDLGPCENIVVSNCTLMSTSAALKIGTESESDFRSISVSNCVISGTNRGISLQLRDKGNIEDVVFSNIHIRTRRFGEHWWGKAEPVTITVLPRHEGTTVGTVRNVHFENINCDGENGIFLYAEEPGMLQDVSFRRVRVRLRKTSRWPAGSWDLRPCAGQSVRPAKVYGFACVNGQNIRREDLRVECEQSMQPWYGGETCLQNTQEN